MDASGSTSVLVLDLPPSTFCGIDLLSFTTSARFKGIRQVPEGFHFLFTGTDSAFSLRHGLWFKVAKPVGIAPQTFIFKWQMALEELVAEEDEAANLRWRANLGSVWREGLTPYRQSIPDESQRGDAIEEAHDWPKLTDCISEALLSRVLKCSSGNMPHWSLTSASTSKEDADNIPGLQGMEALEQMDVELGFLPIDLKRTWREGAVGRERTEAAQDRSWALSNLMSEHCDHPLDIIGEMQMSFIMVLTLNNNSCLEQWKRILHLVLTCKAAAVKQAAFFVRFLSALKLQLEHCSDAEDGLFDLSDQGANLLKSLLKRFRQGLEQQPGSQSKIDVMDELDDLEDFLKEEYGWLMNDPHVRRGPIQLEDGEQIEMDMNNVDEEDEMGEYAPAISDMDPDLLAQWQSQNRGSLMKSTRESSRLIEDSGSNDECDEVVREASDDGEEMDPRF